MAAFGESRQRSFQYTVQGGGRQYQATLSAQVMGIGTVTVPAGTFDAFKIVRKLDYHGFKGTSPWAGTWNDVVWYSPQMMSYVKSEITDLGVRGASDTAVRELLSHHRH